MADLDEATLVGPGGRPAFGLRKSPLRIINPEDLRRYGQDKPSPGDNNWIRRMNIKRWQYMGVCTEEIIFGLAVIDLKYLGNMFCYLFDRKSGQISEYSAIHPFGLNTSLQGSSVEGITRFRGKSMDVCMENRGQEVHLKLSLKNECHGEITFQRYGEPLSIITRIGRHGFNYTHKEAGIPARGTIQFKGIRHDICENMSYGVLDYTIGHLLKYTFWNWAAGGGIDSNGRRIGFNLVAGVNDTGFTENAFWIDGKLFKTDVVDFRYDDLNFLSPWKIVSNDGKVNLTFYPEGERKANVNAGIILSRFHQPFGRFEGTLQEGDTTVSIKQAFGFTEEHEAKW